MAWHADNSYDLIFIVNSAEGGGGGLSIPVVMNQYRQRWKYCDDQLVKVEQKDKYREISSTKYSVQGDGRTVLR